jgi:hypothetical protein
MRILKLTLALAMMLTFMVSCDDSGTQSFDENVTITPANPMGSVGGVVFDGASDAPLADIEVTVMVGATAVITVTDEFGFFSVSDLPATGNAVILYKDNAESEAYLRANQTISFAESESNLTYESPTATANPVWLLKANNSLKIRLIDYEGRPLTSVPLTLNMEPSFLIMGETNIEGRGELHRQAGTNGLGFAEFTKLPDIAQMGASEFASAKIYVPDVDIDGDGYPDYKAKLVTIDLRSVVDTTETIILSKESTSTLSVINSNLPYMSNSVMVYPGTFAPSAPINVLFNRIPATEDLTVTLYKSENDGTEPWVIEPSLSGQLLEFILPDNILPGQKYYLQIYAHTPDNGSVYQKTIPIFTTPEEGLTILSMVKDDDLTPGSPLTVTFNQYVGTGTTWYNTLTGTDGVVFLNWDFNLSMEYGDGPSEHGYYTTQIVFEMDEDSPAWLSGYSLSTTGFSNKWRVYTYGTPSAGTNIYFDFDNTQDSAHRIKSPAGHLINNIEDVLGAK